MRRISLIILFLYIVIQPGVFAASGDEWKSADEDVEDSWQQWLERQEHESKGEVTSPAPTSVSGKTQAIDSKSAKEIPPEEDLSEWEDWDDLEDELKALETEASKGSFTDSKPAPSVTPKPVQKSQDEKPSVPAAPKPTVSPSKSSQVKIPEKTDLDKYLLETEQKFSQPTPSVPAEKKVSSSSKIVSSPTAPKKEPPQEPAPKVGVPSVVVGPQVDKVTEKNAPQEPSKVGMIPLVQEAKFDEVDIEMAAPLKETKPISPKITPADKMSKRADKDPVPAPNLFVKSFYLPANQRLDHQAMEVNGFVFIPIQTLAGEEKYAIVTNFGGPVLKTQVIDAEVADLMKARQWIKNHVETSTFEGVEIKRLPISQEEDGEKYLYWVGQKSFKTVDEAKNEIAVTKASIEAQGGNFSKMVEEAKSMVQIPEEEPQIEIAAPSNQGIEEELLLKYLDQLDIGEKLWGPFHGDASGEPLVWQSFGETSWRNTNLEATDYNNQVGYWTNRLVFKGIRAPLSTIDPYVEATMVFDTTGIDFKSHALLYAGLEWRPFSQNPWLFNYRPWGGMALLEWLRNLRLHVQYGDRKNIKDVITGSKGYNLIAAANIFYEWGVELPPIDQLPPIKFSEYVEQIVWGEYFGNYGFDMTGYSTEDDYDAFFANSSLIFGVKLPGIPLPHNPINDELVLMPYMRFEHSNNSEFSFPFQNQYFVAAGVRIMPFRTYRFKENEWLSKTKIFGEFVGVGLVQHAKQDGEAPNAIRYDFRVGVSMSSRRF